MTMRVTVGDLKIGPQEKKYVNEVLDSNRLSYGPFSRRFEAMFAELHDCKHAIFCNSGTSALHIAVAALKDRYRWADGDEVIVPATTFVATCNVVLHNNLRPVFVDVCPETYNINPALIERAITKKTRAIVPVHLTGLPADMVQINRIAEYHGLRIIEDSCETTFASCAGKKVGSWGDIGCFSTYMAHYIVCGIGGLATTNDPDLAVRLRSLMNHGRDSIYLSIDDDNGLTGDKLKEVIARRFKFQHLGHSFRCTEMEAALGLAQLEKSDEIVARRKAIAARYTQGLQGLSDRLQLPTAAPPNTEHVYMIYPIRVLDKDKTELVNFLESKGIETRDLLPLINQPVYQKLLGNHVMEAGNEVSRELLNTAFYVGCHQFISDEDADHVVGAFYEFYGRERS